jgi:hypothetical protein
MIGRRSSFCRVLKLWSARSHSQLPVHCRHSVARWKKAESYYCVVRVSGVAVVPCCSAGAGCCWLGMQRLQWLDAGLAQASRNAFMAVNICFIQNILHGACMQRTEGVWPRPSVDIWLHQHHTTNRTTAAEGALYGVWRAAQSAAVHGALRQ